jgi:hypothetical protein
MEALLDDKARGPKHLHAPEVVESASDCIDGELKEESIVAVWAVKCR